MSPRDQQPLSDAGNVCKKQQNLRLTHRIKVITEGIELRSPGCAQQARTTRCCPIVSGTTKDAARKRIDLAGAASRPLEQLCNVENEQRSAVPQTVRSTSTRAWPFSICAALRIQRTARTHGKPIVEFTTARKREIMM